MIDGKGFPAHMIVREFANGTFDYVIRPPDGWKGTPSETMVWCREEAARLGVPLMGRVGFDGFVQHRVAELPPTKPADELHRACGQAVASASDVEQMLAALDEKAAQWVDDEDLPQEDHHLAGRWLLSKDSLRREQAARLISGAPPGNNSGPTA